MNKKHKEIFDKSNRELMKISGKTYIDFFGDSLVIKNEQEQILVTLDELKAIYDLVFSDENKPVENKNEWIY